MKKINRMLSILIVFLMVLSLCPLAEAEGEFEDWTKNADKVYSISKTWEIQFNMEINGDTANDTNVYVLDSDGARVPVIVEHWDNIVYVNAPQDNYKAGDYTLYITRGIKSTSETGGKTLTKGVSMKFTIVPFAVDYLKDDNEAEIIKYNGSGGPVEIPREIDGRTVVAIVNSTFKGINLTSVKIPDSVRTIERNAFEGSTLESVDIPNSVTSIGESAFINCRLTELTIPDSVTEIGNSAFKNNQLSSLTLSKNLTSIGADAFAQNKLKEVEIPNLITRIESGTFYDNELESVTIPDSVKFIDYFAFPNNKLTSVKLGKDCVYDPGAFDYEVIINGGTQVVEP